MSFSLTLADPIRNIPGVGIHLEKRFHKLGIRTIRELLAWYPKRYDDFRSMVPLARVTPGSRVQIKARINLIENHRSPRRRMMITEALLSDTTASIKAVWFNQPYIARQLKVGDTVFLAGKAELDEYGFHLISPTFEKESREQTHTARIVPIYGLTESLTAKQLRYVIRLVLPVARQIVDWLPAPIVSGYHLAGLADTIRMIHFPRNGEELNHARERIKFNELLMLQLRAGLTRQQLNTESAQAIPFDQGCTKRFVSSLPFPLTKAQKRSAWEIVGDMKKNRPMNRLLEGDVGSGKTVVAALAIVNAASSGVQTALMSPTEILAEQHFWTLTKLLRKERIRVALLTGSLVKYGGKPMRRPELKKLITTGGVDVVAGTHALIQQGVEFHNLGLVIVDEQHRFGVNQRKKLAKKSPLSSLKSLKAQNNVPHFLSMTATPIPRSLALTIYGDLDLSIIDELPPGRKPIITTIVPPHERRDTYDFIRKEIASGRQVFVICPLIDPSDTLGVKSVKQEAERLSRDIFPNLSIGTLHGRLGAKRKEQVMRDMAQGKLQILCATAVVEVGLDIPNASVMLIEGAERFGLAQLHQFRGRVGRSQHQSYCFLLSDTESQSSIDRLHALVEAKTGFELAEKDLEFRGPGDIFGSRQTGLPQLKMATLADHVIIKQTREAVKTLLSEDPSLVRWPLLKKKVEQYERSLHLE